MKLKRRDFLKSIVPALIGGRKMVEDLVRDPVAEPVDLSMVEKQEIIDRWHSQTRIDTPTCFSATAGSAFSFWDNEEDAAYDDL